MRSIDVRTATEAEIAAWSAEFDAAIEDGSLRAEVDATIDPEWNAKYGDASWDAALMCFGYISPAEAEARSRERQDKT
jgi:N-acyl-D-aspartate/D-glutamate deacylase